MIEEILVFGFSFLSFLIFYGILNKIKIFGRGTNLIISTSSSLLLLLTYYFYLNEIKYIFSFFALFVFVLLILLSLYFFKRGKDI